MPKTNRAARSGTLAFILMALGLTAPVFNGAAASPVTEVVDIVTQKALRPLNEVPPSLTLQTPAPQKQVSHKMVQATTPSSTNRGYAAMQLRLIPRFSLAIFDGIDRSDQNELQRLTDIDSQRRRFQVTVTDQGQTHIFTQVWASGWPGHPAADDNWSKRSVSREMRQEIDRIINRCAASKSANYFFGHLTLDELNTETGVGPGGYEVECVPGTKQARKSVTDIELAKAYLAADELPLSDRHGNFDWKMSFAMMEDYVVKNPNATLEDDRKACVRIYNYLLDNYDFIGQDPKSGTRALLKKCPSANYNWFRKKAGIPEIL